MVALILILDDLSTTRQNRALVVRRWAKGRPSSSFWAWSAAGAKTIRGGERMKLRKTASDWTVKSVLSRVYTAPNNGPMAQVDTPRYSSEFTAEASSGTKIDLVNKIEQTPFICAVKDCRSSACGRLSRQSEKCRSAAGTKTLHDEDRLSRVWKVWLDMQNSQGKRPKSKEHREKILVIWVMGFFW